MIVIIYAGVSFFKSEKMAGWIESVKQEKASDYESNSSPVAENEEPMPREKLSADACVRTGQMIQDNLEWITDTETVEQALEDFYEMTGVEPYLYICDNLDGKGEEITDEEAEKYLKGMYDTLYDDEGHMIFVFMEYAPSEYITFLYTGKEADKVMDAAAREIFLTNADRFYTDSSLSDEEYFAKIFREAANQIM